MDQVNNKNDNFQVANVVIKLKFAISCHELNLNRNKTKAIFHVN